MAATAREIMLEQLRRLAAVDLLACYRYCWWMPTPLRVGRHTRAICERLTRATFDFLAGRSSHVIISVPFRHGKSDIVSRVFPAWFLGVCAARQPNVILSGYGSSLVKGFSEKVRAIVRSDAYRQVFPGVEADREKTATDEWKLKDSQSTVYAQGLGGAITGKGGNLIVVDDYCKNWEEAESKTMRDKTFESFSADLSTRTNSPAHVIVICATRWHEDDVIGRLERRMRENPSYTRWDELVFPARKEGEGGWDMLFPELYDAQWYEFQRKNLGPHAAAALLDCDPRTSGARVFREEWLRYWTEAPDERRLKIHVFVDGAKSKSDGADFTSILTVGRGCDGCYYVLDWVHARLNLAEKIREVFKVVGRFRPKMVWWEQVGPMSDVESLRIQMDRDMDHFPVRELSHTTNKDFRIRKLVVPFDNGEVMLPPRLLKHRELADGTVESYDAVEEFREQEYLPYCGKDSTPHDDMVDCLADILDPEVMELFTPPRGGSGANPDTRRAVTSNPMFSRGFGASGRR